MKILVVLVLVIGCGGEAYDEPAVEVTTAADAGVRSNPDYGWCKAAGWPEVPRCKVASELNDAN